MFHVCRWPVPSQTVRTSNASFETASEEIEQTKPPKPEFFIQEHFSHSQAMIMAMRLFLCILRVLEMVWEVKVFLPNSRSNQFFSSIPPMARLPDFGFLISEYHKSAEAITGIYLQIEKVIPADQWTRKRGSEEARLRTQCIILRRSMMLRHVVLCQQLTQTFVFQRKLARKSSR